MGCSVEYALKDVRRYGGCFDAAKEIAIALGEQANKFAREIAIVTRGEGTTAIAVKLERAIRAAH